jgi:hypothetical protein
MKCVARICVLSVVFFSLLLFPACQKEPGGAAQREPGGVTAEDVEDPKVFFKLADLPANNPEGLRLAISAPKTTVKENEGMDWSAEIINEGSQEVILVQPGDGSQSAMRTPIIQWNDDQAPPKLQERECGNINDLRPNEVFSLKPGQRAKVGPGWIGQPWLVGPGKHRVSMRYANLPNLRWTGFPFLGHDEPTMAKVKLSTPVNLVSNEIEITVLKKDD